MQGAKIVDANASRRDCGGPSGDDGRGGPSEDDAGRWHSRGYLPHFDGGERPQMVTFRLADSFPRHLLDAWADELSRLPEREAATERYRRIEAYIDRGAGAAWLRDPRIARAVQDGLLHFDGDRYRLHAWVVMPNHAHAVVTPLAGHDVSDIVHSWKHYTARLANRLLRRQGDFWYRDYYDRAIRDERHYAAAIAYVEANPVRARLCADAEGWAFGSAAHRH